MREIICKIVYEIVYEIICEILLEIVYEIICEILLDSSICPNTISIPPSPLLTPYPHLLDIVFARTWFSEMVPEFFCPNTISKHHPDPY